jgi:prolipoprotein diacylglyceryltransferase
MIEEMGSLTNLGDLLIITFYLAIAAGIITAIVLFSRSYRKRKEQLDRIEDQLNHLSKK